MFHSDKQADAITERPSERVSSDKDATGVMMQSSKMGESVGMILLFVPMNHQEVGFYYNPNWEPSKSTNKNDENCRKDIDLDFKGSKL